MTHKSAFIEDGYTRHGYLAETDVLPAFRFDYRPPTNDELRSHFDKIDRENQIRGVDGANKVLNDWVAGRVVSWDLISPSGHKVQITPNNVGKIDPALYGPMYGILIGTRQSDADPQTESLPINEETEQKN